MFLGNGVLKICGKFTGKPMPKCVAKQLYWNRTSAWVFSSKFAALFSEHFYLRTPLDGCFCKSKVKKRPQCYSYNRNKNLILNRLEEIKSIDGRNSSIYKYFSLLSDINSEKSEPTIIDSRLVYICKSINHDQFCFHGFTKTRSSLSQMFFKGLQLY